MVTLTDGYQYTYGKRRSASSFAKVETQRQDAEQTQIPTCPTAGISIYNDIPLDVIPLDDIPLDYISS